jgi:hypothetical protein
MAAQIVASRVVLGSTELVSFLVDVYTQVLLTLALVGGQWPASRHSRFNARTVFTYPLDARLGGP